MSLGAWAKSLLVSMLFNIVKFEMQGMRINRILPECFVRRVCYWKRSLLNEAVAQPLEARSLWQSPVSILEEKYSCSRLLGPTAAALLKNGVDHGAP